MATYNDGLEILNIPKEWRITDNLYKLTSKLPSGLGASAVAYNADEEDIWVTTIPGTNMSDLVLLRSRVYDILSDLGVDVFNVRIYIVKNGQGSSGKEKYKKDIVYDDKEVI